MNERTERLRASLEEPLLVTTPVNIRYLAGFQSTNAALLVEPDRVRLFSDFRYAEAAREVGDVEFTETRRNLFADLAERLSGRIAFEADHLTYAAYETLVAGELDLVARRGLVEALRAVKEAGELDAIRRASEITDVVYEQLSDEPFVGRSERDVAWWMEQQFRELGGEGIAFPIIVASGANGSRPHARATDRVIGRGETVVIDAGCSIDGYYSDCTRTFATGPLDDELGEAYDVCLRAQQAGTDAVRAGARGIDVDATARRVVDGSRFEGTFGHGLGHGIGLVVHEAPRLSQESQDTLAAGNVVTVEPGIYLAGRAGIRIEDLVIVGDEGAEVVTRLTKELVTVQ